LIKEIEASVAKYGKTGFIDRAALSRQNVASPQK
jgi:hypothetical protein